MVCQAVRPVPRIQQTRRANFHARGIPRRSGKLHPLAPAISRRARRIASPISTAADGCVLHARTGLDSTRTDSRAERAGGSLVENNATATALQNCSVSFYSEV